MKQYLVRWIHRDGREIDNELLTAPNIKEAKKLADFHKRMLPEVRKYGNKIRTEVTKHY